MRSQQGLAARGSSGITVTFRGRFARPVRSPGTGRLPSREAGTTYLRSVPRRANLGPSVAKECSRMAQRNKALPGRDPDPIQRAKSGLTVRLERAFRPLISHKKSPLRRSNRKSNLFIHLLHTNMYVSYADPLFQDQQRPRVHQVHSHGSSPTAPT